MNRERRTDDGTYPDVEEERLKLQERAAASSPQLPSTDNGKPYSIGSDHWTGLSKLIEEAGEVLQVAGKILGTGGEAEHWDGTNLRSRLEEELADLTAAITFVARHNDLDEASMQKRADAKLARFAEWHKAGQ